AQLVRRLTVGAKCMAQAADVAVRSGQDREEGEGVALAGSLLASAAAAGSRQGGNAFAGRIGEAGLRLKELHSQGSEGQPALLDAMGTAEEAYLMADEDEDDYPLHEAGYEPGEGAEEAAAAVLSDDEEYHYGGQEGRRAEVGSQGFAEQGSANKDEDEQYDEDEDGDEDEDEDEEREEDEGGQEHAYDSVADEDGEDRLCFDMHGGGGGTAEPAVGDASGSRSASPDADSDSRLIVILVEDEVERLCMMEAGVHNVLALPPRAVLDYQMYSELKARAKARARTGTGTGTGTPPVQRREIDVMSYMFNSRRFLCPEPAVVGGKVRVTLALRDTAESCMLAEELATGLARERCRVLHWPAEEAELPPSSHARQRAAMTWPPPFSGDDHYSEFDPGPDYLQEDFAEDAMQQTAYGETNTGPGPQWPRQSSSGGGGASASWGVSSGWDAGAGMYSGTPASWTVGQSSPMPSPPMPPGKHQQQEQRQGQRLRGCAMDVLLEDGSEALRYLVHTARPYPVRGLLDVTGLWGEMLQHWYGKEQTAAGVSTGWPGLDELYKVAPGELTVVTGVPNSGKSHWLDALAVQLASGSGWRIAFASFEKSVVRHAQNLIELAAQKPMFNSQGIPQLSPEEFHEALHWVDDHFVLIRHADMADEPAGVMPEALVAAAVGHARPPGRGGFPHETDLDSDMVEVEEADDDLAMQELEDARQPCTIDWVLAKATQAVYRYGIRGLVIDPYNELEQRRGAQTETEYVSAMLGKVKRWAQRYLVHVWLVAHPKSMEDWDGGPPNMYDISGSAHWYNKADMGLVVHRYTRVAIDAALRRRQAATGRSGGRGGKPLQVPWRENETLIKVLKARNKTSGTQGDYTLEYDKEQCRFRDPRVEPGRY
ncbi:hypothetical protein Vafri_4176, partial [Volvox africanus]